MQEVLFTKHGWSDVERHQLEKVKQEIVQYNGNKLLNTPLDDLYNYFFETYKLDVPQILEDKIYIDQNEIQVDVSHDPYRAIFDRNRPVYIQGTQIKYIIPYIGDKEMFFIQPTTYDLSPPRASVHDGHIEISISGADLTSQNIRNSFTEIFNSIKLYLSRLSNLIPGYNDKLRAQIYSTIDSRKKKLLNDQNLVSDLGFPLKQRQDSPFTYVTNGVKRKLRPTPPEASSSPYVPEPVLSDSDYEYILDIINRMSLVMERCPISFNGLDEESLRMFFLMSLNGHFEGKATGETFNYKGKTDILIRENDKNIFIGECKFWGGPKKLTDTIDQLLNYSSWRDSKTAIILFNRNKNFSDVLKSIPPVVHSHKNFKKDLGNKSETIFKYKFKNKVDDNKELFLTILAFDIPS